MINLIFLGHYNQADLLAGVGIGNMFMNMTGLSISIGLNGALETLISQAMGAGNIRLCGIYLNRGRFVLMCSNIPTILMLSQTEKILLMIGQNEIVSKHA